MKDTWKRLFAGVALSSMVLGITGGNSASATGTTAPAPAATSVPPPAEGGTGSADRGIKCPPTCPIKDRGGPEGPQPQTNREAAPTPQATGGGNAPAPAAAERIETGQLIIRPRPNPPSVESQSPGGAAPTTATGNQEAERRAHSGPGGTPPAAADRNGTPRNPNSGGTPPAAATGGGFGGGPRVTTSRNRTGLLLGTLSGIAALAFAVSSGGSDSPVSP